MDFQYLFTSFDGRTNRAKWWAGMVILAVVNIVLSFIVISLFGMGFFGRLISFIIGLALLYPAYAVFAVGADPATIEPALAGLRQVVRAAPAPPLQ